MKCKLIAASAVLATLTLAPAHAVTYDVNIFGPLPDGVTAGPNGTANSNACSATICAGGPTTAHSFYAQAGDVIDFGTLSLGSFTFGDGRQTQSTEYLGADGQLHFGFGFLVSLYNGSLVVATSYTPFMLLGSTAIGTCNTADPACNLLGNAYSQPIDLTFTLGDSGFIELGWTEPYIYTAPATVGIEAVPELSTWAMLLLGFAGLSLLRWRRPIPA